MDDIKNELIKLAEYSVDCLVQDEETAKEFRRVIKKAKGEPETV